MEPFASELRERGAADAPIASESVASIERPTLPEPRWHGRFHYRPAMRMMRLAAAPAALVLPLCLWGVLGATAAPVTATAPTAATTDVDAGLPTDGTVYSVTDLFGMTNIYQAIPGTDGGAATISDVLSTPFGDMDLSWMFSGFDATANFDPGDIL